MIMQKNMERMLALVGEVFDVRNDPDQLQVAPDVLERLETLHARCVTQIENEDGPYCWLLGIPTTANVMRRFLAGTISEQRLFDLTHPGDVFEAIYLCSATVLPEFRNKGIAKKAALEMIAEMRRDHPISTLYYWKFTDDGQHLAETLSRATGLPLLTRDH